MRALPLSVSSRRRVLVLDLSNNNPGPDDFAVAKAHGLFGVWLKVSEGQSFTDSTYADRARRARAAGLHVGGYHFARPKLGQAPAEAAYFASRLGRVHRRDLRPVLDLEANDDHLSSSELWTWAHTFLAHLHLLAGVRGLTYSNVAYVTEQRWPHTLGSGAGLWLADFGPDDGRDHGARAPAPWRRFVAHQYTSKGRHAGIAGHVDLSHSTRRLRLLAHPLRGLA